MAKNFPLSLYYSVTAGAVPNVLDLDRGTPAFNIVDKKMFMRTTTTENAATPDSDVLLTFDLTPQALESLSNVSVSGAASNQVLTFNGSKWVNATVTSAMISDFVEKVKEVVGMDDAGLVHTEGDETINGTKTFSITPLVTSAQVIGTAAENEVAKVATLKTQTIYTDNSANGATVAIGGIAKGKKYENANVVDIINDLLHPYVAPTNVRLTLGGVNGGVFEMGSTQSVTGATVNWTRGSQNVTKAEVMVSGSPVGAADVSSDTGSSSVSLTQEVSANTTFSARVTDATKQTTGGNVTFTFVYPMYQGVVAAETTLDQGAITGLNKVVQTKGNKTYSYTTNGSQQVVFAYPASYGDLKSVLDPNNFECLDTFTKTTVTITGLDSTPQQYNVYAVTTNVQGFAYTFKF